MVSLLRGQGYTTFASNSKFLNEFKAASCFFQVGFAYAAEMSADWDVFKFGTSLLAISEVEEYFLVLTREGNAGPACKKNTPVTPE